jgi:protein-disulfide isomerase
MIYTKLARNLGTIGAICLLLAACNKKSTSEEGSGDAAGKTVEVTGNPCTALAEKICGEVGKESPSCESAKGTLELLADKACSVGLKEFEATKAKLKKQGKKCEELVEKLCAGVGTETESCKMVREKTKGFPPAQCTTMLGQVDEIIKELKQHEKANQPLDTAAQAKIASGDAPAFGPADAKVTLVEFSDFECPYCSRAATVTSQLKEKYGTKVRFVFRQFPLPFHQSAQGAAEAALAAHAQGKFWEFHDKVFQNQKSLDRASLEGYAKAVGLDMGKFKAALDSAQTKERVKADMAIGNEVAVQGTPTLFLNGKRVENPTDFAELSKAIDSALGG